MAAKQPKYKRSVKIETFPDVVKLEIGETIRGVFRSVRVVETKYGEKALNTFDRLPDDPCAETSFALWGSAMLDRAFEAASPGDAFEIVRIDDGEAVGKKSAMKMFDVWLLEAD